MGPEHTESDECPRQKRRIGKTVVRPQCTRPLMTALKGWEENPSRSTRHFYLMCLGEKFVSVIPGCNSVDVFLKPLGFIQSLSGTLTNTNN